MKALEAIKQKAEYSALKLSYGKDRCANPPRANNHSAGNGNNGGRSRHASAHNNGDGEQQASSTNGTPSASIKNPKKDESEVAELEGALRATSLDNVKEE